MLGRFLGNIYNGAKQTVGNVENNLQHPMNIVNNIAHPAQQLYRNIFSGTGPQMPAPIVHRPVGLNPTTTTSQGKTDWTPSRGGAPMAGNYLGRPWNAAPIPSFMGNQYMAMGDAPEFENIDPMIFGFPSDTQPTVGPPPTGLAMLPNFPAHPHLTTLYQKLYGGK